MKKFVVLFLCLVFVRFGWCQDLKDLATYENSLKSYYAKSWKAQREEFKGLNQKKFVNYMPDIGFVFGLPSISWHTSEFFRYQRDKHLVEKKLKSLDMKVELEMNEQLMVLAIEYEKLQMERERIKVAQDKYDIQAAIYAIGVECCEKRECTPEVCKTKELERYEASEVIKLMRIAMKVSILELEKLAKYGIKSERLMP